MTCDLTIIGCGPGGPDYVTAQARDAVSAARVLIGSRRLLNLFDPDAPAIPCPARSAEAIGLIEKHLAEGPVTVLVTGDPGLCSLATPLVKHFGADRCQLIPGISSVQVAFARLGLDWRDAKIISSHADLPADSFQELTAFGTIAVLGGGSRSVEWIQSFCNALGTGYSLHLCENLTLESESIRRITPDGLMSIQPQSLSIYVVTKE